MDKGNYGGKCKLKGCRLHESSAMLNKGKTSDSVKEAEQFLSGEMKKRKKEKDCNASDSNPNMNRSILRKDYKCSEQESMSM